MGKSTINGHFQKFFVCLPEGNFPIKEKHTHWIFRAFPSQQCFLWPDRFFHTYPKWTPLTRRVAEWSTRKSGCGPDNKKTPGHIPLGKHRNTIAWTQTKDLSESTRYPKIWWFIKVGPRCCTEEAEIKTQGSTVLSSTTNFWVAMVHPWMA